MIKIDNMAIYLDGLHKTIFDKCFFVDKVDASIFVDYGCSDGSLINLLSQTFPQNFYIGLDANTDMLELAKRDTKANTMFVGSVEELVSVLEKKEGKKCLILNSVLHEIHSFGTPENIYNFYDFVFNGMFDYICVRDMMPSYSINHMSSEDDVKKVRETLASKLQSSAALLVDFEKHWGSINFQKNLYHFLLKYRYVANWRHEVYENYFSVCKEDILDVIPDSYELIYSEEFILPYAKRIVKEDFGIDLNENTHIKFVLKKKS